MLTFIREEAGLGNSAIYVRLRKVTGEFWNFNTLTWVTPQVNDCRVFLTEYDDSATLDSLYSGSFTMPSSGPHIQEAVLVSTGEVIGSDLTAIDTQVSDITTQLTNIQGAGWTNQTLKDIREAIDTVIVSQGVPVILSPDVATRVIGDNDGGVVGDIAAHDEVAFSTGEVVGTGLEVVLDWTTTDPDYVPSVLRISGWYNGGGTHNIGVSAWNYQSSSYDYKLTMLQRGGYFDYTCGLTSDNHDSITGAIKIKFKHSVSTYSASHVLHLDWVAVEKVATTNELASDIAAIKAKTDGLNFVFNDVKATLDGEIVIPDLTEIKGIGWTIETLKEIYDAIEASIINQGIPISFPPDIATRVIGDNEGGTVASMAARDENPFATGEVVGTGLEVILDWTTTDVDSIPSTIRFCGQYHGHTSHEVDVYAWNYVDSTWKYKLTMRERSGYFDYTAGLGSGFHNPATGAMSLRFKHNVVGTYAAGDYLWIDYLVIDKVVVANQMASQVASIKAKTDQLSFILGDVVATLDGEPTSADLTGIALTTDVTDARDTIIAHGDLNWTSGSGLIGTNAITITVEVNSLPALDVDVCVYNEDETAFIGRTKTDLTGIVSFSLDNGTYKIRLLKPGFYMPVNPVETLVVNGPENVTYEMDAIVIPVSGVPSICRLYEYLYTPEAPGDIPVDEKLAIATLQATSVPYTGQIFDATFERDIDGTFTGLVYWDIVYGTSVRVYIPYVLGNKEKKFVVPSVALAQITTL